MSNRIKRLIAAAAAAAAACTAGSSTSSGGEPLVIYAASDLTNAFDELRPAFESAVGPVSLVYGSTGNLARQIEHGAPADVFFAADVSFVNRLATAGLVSPGTERRYAQGRIVLARARSVNVALDGLEDLLDDAIRHVAIANPQYAPYGRAAEQAMRRAGLWDRLQPKIVVAETVRQAMQYVESGAADAGVVARSIAAEADVAWTPVDGSMHDPIVQAAAVLERTQHPDRAAAVLGVVDGSDGRAVLKRFGFLVPGEF